MRTCLIKETSTYFVSENGRVFSIDHKDRSRAGSRRKQVCGI